MATAILPGSDAKMSNGALHGADGQNDPFVQNHHTPQPIQSHRYSSHFDPDSIDLSHTASPNHVKRTLEAHLVETERRLQDTQKLGTSLLKQQTELTEKLREVETQQDEAEITPELRQRLADLEKEHNDVGKEIARALLPKSRAVSGEEKPAAEASTYSSQATASPTKVTAPSRRQRNQPINRAGDLQFAADISTSLLAQVRQLQAAVAERDEIIKKSQADHSRIEQDTVGLSQRLRTLDENEQRYKDENWNLETQNHELVAAAREAAEREKKLSASLATALAEKGRVQNEMDEIRLAHGKLTDEHAAAKKTHDSELHSLKRTVDLGDGEKMSLQSKVEELTAQNQELARAMASRHHGQQFAAISMPDADRDAELRDLSTPEHSPPPSPTKGTPRHGGLESETLRSSLHHAHRMIQNLKNNIHREKTEKIELKRMLQDARDELEQRRTDGLGSGNKRQKIKPDPFKKPVRPDMLGGSRRSRTDVEIEDQDWEDHAVDSPSQQGPRRHLPVPGAFNQRGLTDVSDAYQTGTETEGPFETADEKQGTESEDFQTGAESLAGDSTDDLTETEETGARAQRTSTIRAPQKSLAFKPAGDRTSFMSTASTSAGEDDEDLKTPLQTQTQKFRLKNGRQSFARQSRQPDGTPESYRALSAIQDSPASLVDGRSPPAAEQSLYAELGEFDDVGSDRFGTPGRASIASANSTPYAGFTPSNRVTSEFVPASVKKRAMVDSSMMTEPWEPKTKSWPGAAAAATGTAAAAGIVGAAGLHHYQPGPPSPSDFPLPPSVPGSPVRKTDTSTQYTPQRGLQESPIRGVQNFITPPKTVWDEAQDHETVSQHVGTGNAGTSLRQLDYSAMLTQDTVPVSPVRSLPTAEPTPPFHAYSDIQTQQTEPVSPPRPTTSAYQAVTLNNHDAERPKTAERFVEGAAAGGLLATAAAALGFSMTKDEQRVDIAEDETSGPPALDIASSNKAQMPLKDIADNNAFRRAPAMSKAESDLENAAPIRVSSNDQSSQTMLTADQIERALRPKIAPIVITSAALPAAETARTLSPKSALMAVPPRSLSRPQDASMGTEAHPITPGASPSKRPTSSSSQRTSASIAQHPPLPSDHKTVIAKAGGRVTSPTQEMSNSSHVAALMGPPTVPASAMRRPRTPAEASVRSPTPTSAAPRPSYATIRNSRGAGTASQLSRRSSVSSFASELDERFNIRPDAPTASHGFEASPGTDPRMIQAITQTMIGEFLWKYTRKAGRSEMSATRHRRYFWVHPYTKTLYWSDQDPQTAGRSELKAKSVAIESVRVVTDDNPMPPGLHRKSLEVTTPGRKVKFTAQTGQRHETWFNALSYLLLRSEERDMSAYTAGGNEITRDDIDEFNVGANGYGARLVPSHSRMSMSSYNSRTTRGTSANRASVRQSQALPSGVIATSYASRTPQGQAQDSASRTTANTTVRRSRAEQPHEADKDRTLRAASMSRFSRMLGSVTGRSKGEQQDAQASAVAGEENGSIYNASIVSDSGRRDSAEELRREMLRQEREGLGGGLENVRACCDGKHDVSTLHHMHSGHGHSQSHAGRPVAGSHRVMSFRGTMGRKSTASVSNTSTGGAGPSS